MTRVAGRRSRRGAALLDAFLAMAVVSMIGASVVLAFNTYAERQRTVVAGQKMSEVVEASKNYIKYNVKDLLAATASGATVRVAIAKLPTGAEPFTSTSPLKSLQEAGFLPPSYRDYNPYQQYHALLVRKNAGQRLEALVVQAGGRAIEDQQLGMLASQVGAQGGFMASAPLSGAEGMVVGTAGGWGTPAADWTAGGLGPTKGRASSAFALDEGAVVADFLYRRDIGIDEANRMRTDLDMGQGSDRNNINNLRSINHDGVNGSTRRIDFADVEGSTSYLSMRNATSRIRMAPDGKISMSTDVAVDKSIQAGTTVTAKDDISSTAGNVKAAVNVTAGQDVIAGRDVDAGRDVSAGQDVNATRDVNAQNEVEAKRFVDRDNNTFLLDPNGSSKLASLSTDNLDLDTNVYGAVNGPNGLKAEETLGGAASRLWGCRLEYQFARNGGSTGSWATGPLLDGRDTSTGGFAGWSASNLDDECQGGCGIRMRVRCDGTTSGGGTPPPADAECSAGYRMEQGICVPTACPAGASGSPPNCLYPTATPGVDVITQIGELGPPGKASFSFAFCPASHPKVVGGGGDCFTGFGSNFVPFTVSSNPINGNTWQYNCGTNSNDAILFARSYAMCVR